MYVYGQNCEFQKFKFSENGKSRKETLLSHLQCVLYTMATTTCFISSVLHVVLCSVLPAQCILWVAAACMYALSNIFYTIVYVYIPSAVKFQNRHVVLLVLLPPFLASCI